MDEEGVDLKDVKEEEGLKDEKEEDLKDEKEEDFQNFHFVMDASFFLHFRDF